MGYFDKGLGEVQEYYVSLTKSFDIVVQSNKKFGVTRSSFGGIELENHIFL